MIIQLKDVHKHFVLGSHEIKAVNGVTLDLLEGEVNCFLGTSGSGKSTMLNLMAGFEKPTSGSVIAAGIPLETLDEHGLAVFRQKYIGFVFQSYNLIESLTALDNVTLPLTFRGVGKAARIATAREMLKLVGIENYADHKPSQMSGGQQQRVGIARALVCNPRILFADEPTGNLDTHTREEVIQLMISVARKQGQTMVIVTHEPEIARYADRILHMKDGVVDQDIRNTPILEIEPEEMNNAQLLD